MKKQKLYTWRTKKASTGFLAMVIEHVYTAEPVNGHYTIPTTIKNELFPSRDKAKRYAQKCVRYYKSLITK